MAINTTITLQPVPAALEDFSITGADMSNNANIARTQLAQNPIAKFLIPFTDFRVWDDMDTLLPSTPATDDLGLVHGTFGTSSPSLQTEDLKAAGATNNRARAMVRIPTEYDSGETITLRFRAGMLTTVSDTTATLDAEAYKSDNEAGIGSDLVTTAATTINSLTLADIDFTVTPTGVVAGDWLDLRITTAINDGATGTAVIGIIGAAWLLCDIRG